MTVTVFNGQTATMVDCSQRPFVVGVEYVGGAPGFQGACQPKIEVVEEGMKIRFRATQSADLKQVALRSRMQTSVVEEVFTSSMKYHGEAVTIQNPQVSRRDVEFDANVADGESLLVGCMPTDGQEGFFYVLFTPEALSGKTFSKSE